MDQLGRGEDGRGEEGIFYLQSSLTPPRDLLALSLFIQKLFVPEIRPASKQRK